jgi:hypothetical protein
VRAEVAQRGLELRAGQRQPGGDEAALDKPRDALADEIAHRALGQGLEPLPGEHGVDGRGEVGCGVEERAVQVEEDGSGDAA